MTVFMDPLFFIDALQTRVLVTNNVLFLSQMDQIIVLDDGEVIESGTYDELLHKNGMFAELITTYFITGHSDNVDNLEDDDGISHESVFPLDVHPPQSRASLHFVL